MLRLLYLCILRAHPMKFQIRHADEMLWIFDESRTPVRLIADALVSLIRQWLLRPEAQPASKPAGDVPVFASINDAPPPNSVLLQGALATMTLFTLLTYGFGRGGAIGRIVHPAIADTLYVGGQPLPIPSITRRPEPSRSVIGALWIRFLGGSAEPASLATPVLRALDRNTDGKLTPDEIANAPLSLLTLDEDGNGVLEPEECGLLLATALSRDRIREAMLVFDVNRDGRLQPHEQPASLQRPRALSADDLRPHQAEIIRLAFVLRDTVLRTVDDNRDGRISAAEITLSPAALRTLDIDRDGILTKAELQ